MTEQEQQLNFEGKVILVGPADVNSALLDDAITRGDPVIAADGGANWLLNKGIVPKAIIGDLDSFDPGDHDLPDTKIIKISEQNSTDFEKCLRSISAPLFLAIGFTGLRVDHTLSNFHSMIKFHGQKNILLVGSDDISFIHKGTYHSPVLPELSVSVFPLFPIGFLRSEGLLYALDNLSLEIGGFTGTSNRSTTSQFSIVPKPLDQNIPYLITLSGINLAQLVETLSQQY